MRTDLIGERFEEIQKIKLSPLDLLPQDDLREKIIDLVLRGVPNNIHAQAHGQLLGLRQELLEKSVEDVKVVVFGGGTGLSNVIGGDSRRESWIRKPFAGLKEIFPHTKSIVCVTDNGGSTGELLKDLPLVAVGDLRHVLLSSVQLGKLQTLYDIGRTEAVRVASVLSDIFNLRYSGYLEYQGSKFKTIKSKIKQLPQVLESYFILLLGDLFHDIRLSEPLKRPNCLGNLMIAAAIYREIDQELTNNDLARNQELLHPAIFNGITTLSEVIGAGERSVLPCTSTPAQLRVLYTNGVELIGEHKLSESRRGVPVDSIQVDYFDTIRIYDEVLKDIEEADILILAPGSLYSSIIPVFKVPCMAEAVRKNKKALKILVSNLWVQAGETDLSIADPDRKFHVSDMIRAYEKNIPGGTDGLFNEVLCISLKDIPASILQRYAVEGKVPIYLDREVLLERDYNPIECDVYSREALNEEGVIQHDPDTFALAIKGLYNGRSCFGNQLAEVKINSYELPSIFELKDAPSIQPFQKHLRIFDWLNNLDVCCTEDVSSIDVDQLRATIGEIIWDHPIIPLSHLQYVEGIKFFGPNSWGRDQQWDNVFSFFDPKDRQIKILADQVLTRHKLEIALTIALGESLLGDYAKEKVMKDVVIDQLQLGRVYHLYLKNKNQRSCFLNHNQLRLFLALARMSETDDENHYTRLLNKSEGFTPPGLLMGLMYTWYIDNRLATHIEYKMSVMKISHTDLIPEQLKMAERRRKMVEFFKEVVFKQ